MSMKEIDKICETAIDENFGCLWEISSYIHSHPETAFHENNACEKLTDFLWKQGFAVEKHMAGLPTAFKAVFNIGKGPRIAVLAEYDALPELGHACGHNLICTSALGAAIAVQKAMQAQGIQGSIEVYGTPAEEDGGGKIIMLNNGVFDGLDAVFLMHPTSAMTRIGGECISFTGKYITFQGKSAHAESHPEEGINAMDAASLFHQALGVSRQQLPDDLHVCDVIRSISSDIGQIPSKAKLEVELSSPNSKHIQRGEAVVDRIAKGIAIATGCTLETEDISGYLGRIPNQVLGDVCRKELEDLGEAVMEGMPADQGGEDLGNVSRRIPSCNLFASIHPEKKISGHTALFRECAVSDAARHCLWVSSQAMARSILRLMLEPELLRQAKAELKERMEALEKEC